MWQICDIIETFDSDQGIECFKSSVIKRHPHDQLMNYLQILRGLPLTWEDSVTQMDHIYPELLVHLSQGLQKINKPIEICRTPIASQCHSNTLYLGLTYPMWEMYTGFAKIDGECVAGDDWHLHSFCVTTERIVEPTPVIRSVYYGRPISRQQLSTLIKA